jgi:hypothetical protein
MQPLAPEYLSEIGRQLATLSAFLGGFAAAFLGTLLALPSPRREVGWAAGAAALAAAAFTVAVVAATMLSVVLHPAAPRPASRAAEAGVARVIVGLAFFLGLYSLLVALGLSGWARSRRLGIVTGWIAGVAAVVATWALVSF